MMVKLFMYHCNVWSPDLPSKIKQTTTITTNKKQHQQQTNKQTNKKQTNKQTNKKRKTPLPVLSRVIHPI